MSDWAVGDLAVCVDINSWCGGKPSKRLRSGVTYRVLAVIPPAQWTGDYYGEGLVVDGAANTTPDGDWPAPRFRKIRPDEHEACETEFVTLLKRSKRKVSA